VVVEAEAEDARVAEAATAAKEFPKVVCFFPRPDLIQRRSGHFFACESQLKLFRAQHGNRIDPNRPDHRR
jgi:hypothetical protein